VETAVSEKNPISLNALKIALSADGVFYVCSFMVKHRIIGVTDAP
jgi:hypothetical protein